MTRNSQLVICIDQVSRERLCTSFQSIAQAAANACLDLEGPDPNKDGIQIRGLKVVSTDICRRTTEFYLTWRPTSGMILYIAWLMTVLPQRASVAWRNGWPYVECPPRDDGEYEDAPAPLDPNLLVPII